MMNPEGIFRGLWCVDSEACAKTGEELLINLETNQIVAKRINGVIYDPSYKPEVKTEEQPNA
jgi:hypothetical protein